MWQARFISAQFDVVHNPPNLVNIHIVMFVSKIIQVYGSKSQICDFDNYGRINLHIGKLIKTKPSKIGNFYCYERHNIAI